MWIKQNPAKFFVLFFLVLFFGLIGYSLEKNSKEKDINSLTSAFLQNWKDYSNQEYGLAFKYPPDWEITLKNLSKSGENVFFANFYNPKLAGQAKGFSDYENSFVRFLLTSPPGWDTEKRTCDVLKREYVGDCVTDYVYIDGLKALRRTYNIKTVGWNVNARYIEFVKDNKLYHFYTGAVARGEPVSKLASRELYLDEMVASFRFLP